MSASEQTEKTKAADPPASGAGVLKATGRGRDEWFAHGAAGSLGTIRLGRRQHPAQRQFLAKGQARSQVAVEHEKLPDTRTAEKAKTYWRERLSQLKTLLEG